MDKATAQRLVRNTLKAPFDRKRYYGLVSELCNGFDDGKAIDNMRVPDAFAAHVKSCQRLGTFTSPDNELADVLVVQLTESWKLERSRTALRDFVAHKLKRDNAYKEAGLIAFIAPDSQSWRFSYIRMDYETRRDPETGKIKTEERLTPARRYSYLVGADEECYTAQTRFLPLLQNTAAKPTLAQLEEAFSVESVTKEFFNEYARLFKATDEALTAVRADLAAKSVSTVDFAKKLLGQIVFLYFIQKKGWLGVGQGQSWGEGPRHFLRQLADQAVAKEQSLFNVVLEPLFYDTLATDRGVEAWCPRFKCRIPFLNGGLFEPLAGYDWEQRAIALPNALFTNREYTPAGDRGTGILDVFDRYNFTVNEAEPLEKEVAIDPEMLGKVFENLIEENRRKGLGAFYTPREIVHYMCQESLINYLDTTVNQSGRMIERADIEALIREGEQAAHYETARKDGTESYQRRLPKAIEEQARVLDEALQNITVCDPAIGSGAFPVGMMTEIVRARMALTPYLAVRSPLPQAGEGLGVRVEDSPSERTAYHFKRHAIQNSLYGVDIDGGAVEIAKLRLWLSLVVDEEDVQQIKPLPNLDYKVVAGNSLLGVEKNLFNEEYFKQLEALKPQFFDESDRVKKAHFKQQIDKLIHTLTQGKEVFDFEIYFSEVFHKKGGFDVVIGNPPYGFHKIHSDSAKSYFKAHFFSSRGSFEHYFLFYEASLKLLKIGGVQAFIAPVTWLTIPSAKSLRRFVLTDYAISEICWLAEKVFENANVNTLISVIERNRPGDTKVKFFKLLSTFPRNPDAKRIIPQRYFVDSDYYISIFSEAAENEILNKIRKNSRPLGEIAHPCSGYNPYEVGAGIAPEGGPHTERTVKDKPYHSERQHGQQWKPEIVGRNLSRYHVQVTGQRWVKYGPWLAASRDPENFTGRRLLVQEITGGKDKRIVAAFYDGELYHSRDVIPIKLTKQDPDPFYLLGVINSWLISWFHHRCNPKAQKGLFPKVLVSDLKKLPIHCAADDAQRPVVKLVDRILAAKARDAAADTSELEREIDQLVYALYGLTQGEIAVIEGDDKSS